jgi:hypothetical protein
MEPPGYALHLWRDGIGLVSHVASVGEFLSYPVIPGGMRSATA